jgi:hypothetical protein
LTISGQTFQNLNYHSPRFSILGGQAIDTSGGTSTRSGKPKDASEKPDKSEMREEEDED